MGLTVPSNEIRRQKALYELGSNPQATRLEDGVGVAAASDTGDDEHNLSN